MCPLGATRSRCRLVAEKALRTQDGRERLEPFALVEDIELLKVCLAFHEVDDALDNADQRHDAARKAKRQQRATMVTASR